MILLLTNIKQKNSKKCLDGDEQIDQSDIDFMEGSIKTTIWFNEFGFNKRCTRNDGMLLVNDGMLLGLDNAFEMSNFRSVKFFDCAITSTPKSHWPKLERNNQQVISLSIDNGVIISSQANKHYVVQQQNERSTNIQQCDICNGIARLFHFLAWKMMVNA